MNKIYKVVRDHSTGTFKAVSEMAKSHGKGKSLVKKTAAAVIAAASVVAYAQGGVGGCGSSR